MRLIGRHFATSQPIAVEVASSIIRRVDQIPVDALPPNSPWIAPGLVDLQINGFAHQEFSAPSLTDEDVSWISRQLDRFGVTKYCPTVASDHHDALCRTLQTISGACQADRHVSRRVIGVHLEGPYLSAEDGPRGSVSREVVRPPDYDEFRRLQDAAGGRIRLLTLAPEYRQAPAFIERVAASGVVVAIGHTASDSRAIKSAVEAGARLSTHLGNGTHEQLRRHPNYIWDQLAEDRLWASIIADGHHLPGPVVKAFVRAKSPERCILVSDLAGMAGMPPGPYRVTTGGDVELLEDGQIVRPGERRMLVGTTLPLGAGVSNVIRFAGMGLEQAIAMASTRPAELMGAEVVSLAAGKTADLVQFDLPEIDDTNSRAPLQVRATIQAGEPVYGVPVEAVG
jgi:N-acetylglucosamine-6-phosphate deacetylase